MSEKIIDRSSLDFFSMNQRFARQLSPIVQTDSRSFLLLFLIWPFLAFITAIANYSRKESKMVVYIFLIYYGITLAIGSEGIDAARYALKLKDVANLPTSDFFKIIGGLYSETSVDIVEPLISFTVSRFTTYHGFLFAVYAALFGYFYLKSINLLYNRYLKNPGWNAMIHLAFFAAIIPITYINGFRMYAAAWVFFYGAYHVIIYRDAKFLIIALGASLIHFSFILANGILLIYFFAGNRNIIYLPLAIFSFIVPDLFSTIIPEIEVGGSLQDRINMYTNPYYIESVQEQGEQLAWFMKIGNKLVMYYLCLAIVVVKIMQRYLKEEIAEKNLFSFLLLLLTFVNFGMEIPSVGVRFQVVFFLFATLYIYLYFLKLQGNKINLLSLIGLVPMALYAAIAFRAGSETINTWIFAPGFGLPFFAPEFALYELLFN